MRRLSNIKELGRYKNTETNKVYNLKKGRDLARGVDLIYYLYRRQRQFISDADFYHKHEKIN